MGRAPCCDKNGLKKGPWTPEEDEKLRDYIQKHGHGRWRTLPKNSGLSRCGKSCRLRWTNYLRPDIKRGRFSFEEEQVIIELHSILGNKWSAIAARLPGRTDNEIKNFWNTHIRKRLLRMGVDPVTHSPRLDLLDLSTLLNVAALCSNPSQLEFTTLLGVQPALNAELLRMATSLLLGQRQNAELVHQNQLQEQQQQQTPQQFPIPTTEEQFQPSFPPQQLLPNLAQEILVRTPSSAPLAQVNVGSQLHSSDQETLIWPNSSLPCSVQPDSFLLPQNSDFYGGTQSMGAFDLLSTETATDFVPSSSSQEYFSFPSVLPTRASSPTTLNSPSTYVNSTATTTEDERDSYCSNLLHFHMPDLLDDVGELIM